MADLKKLAEEIVGLTLLEAATTTVTFGSSAGVHPLTEQADYGALKDRLAALKLR